MKFLPKFHFVPKILEAQPRIRNTEQKKDFGPGEKCLLFLPNFHEAKLEAGNWEQKKIGPGEI